MRIVKRIVGYLSGFAQWLDGVLEKGAQHSFLALVGVVGAITLVAMTLVLVPILLIVAYLDFGQAHA